jgi:hypothetical protein
VAVGAFSGRLRQTRTMLEASALVSFPTMRLLSSVRMGQVPVMENPARITASRKVSHPVLPCLAVPLAFRLLEGVVDGNRKGRVGLLGQAG